MIDFDFINSFIIYLIIILGIWLAFWVYKNERSGNINKVFSVMIIVILSWIVFYQFAAKEVDVRSSLIMFKISGASVFLFFIFYYFTVYWFIKEKIIYNLQGRIILFYGLILFFLTIFTNLIISSTATEYWGNYPLFSSLGWYLFYSYVIILTLSINILLIDNYFKSPKEKKINIQYFLIGLILFAVLNFVFNVIFPMIFNDYQYYQIGNYSIVFLISFTAYAITKYELMGIKTLLTQVLIVIISLILFIDVLFLSNNFTMQLLKSGILLTFLYFSRELIKSVRKEREARSELENTYKKINQYVEKLEEINTNLEEKNNDLKALLETSNVTTGTLDSRKIAQDIVNSIPANLNHLGYKGGVFILYNKKKGFIHTYAITESKITKKARGLLSKPFDKHLEYIDKADNFVIQTVKTGEIKVGSKLEEFIAPTVSKNICKLIQKMVGAKSFVSIPLFSRGSVVGVMVFVGVKPVAEIAQRDKNILFMFSSHIGSAIENAQLYEQTEKQIKALSVLNENLKVANIKLKELLELKNEFLHITSHQLRTPLTAIRGMISMWCDGDFDDLDEKEKEKMIKRILASTERLNNITNDMLDALELEGGFLKFQFKAIPIENIIKETISTLQPNFDKKGIYIKLKSNPDIPKVEAEPNYIRQVFMNIIDNACNYTKGGGVDISMRKDGEFVEIAVKDTGIGISKADRKKLFEKFSRGGNAIKQNPSGSGLGLFIAKKIIRAHGGKIAIESEGIGKGSTVKMFLLIKHNE